MEKLKNVGEKVGESGKGEFFAIYQIVLKV